MLKLQIVSTGHASETVAVDSTMNTLLDKKNYDDLFLEQHIDPSLN